jgi:hypothetical protein
MGKSSVLKWPSFRLTTAIAAPLLLCVAYLYFVISKRLPAPKVPVVANCKKLEPGMKRVGEQYGFQFDVPLEAFTIDEWAEDAPPGAHGFGLRPKNGQSYLVIQWGLDTIESSPKTRVGVPVPQSLIDSSASVHSSTSGDVEKRGILDDKGNPVGEDSWGYRGRSERWRRVEFRGGQVVARYGPVNEKDAASHSSFHEKEADLFDQVISSACLLSPSGS